MPKRARLTAAIAILSLLPGCVGSDDRSAAAAHIASLYIGADTTGDRDAIDSLRPECDNNDPQSDTIRPVDKVTAGDPFPGNGRDTMVVVAIYHVLGTAHPEDPTLVGTQYWRFVAEPHEDTVILRMAAPQGGPMRIACGPYVSGHLALSQIAAAMAALDSASRNSLSRAKHGESGSP